MSETVKTIAGIPITPASDRPDRICALIWGASGTGKTTLACTAPGKKLLLSFDADGSTSIKRRDDVAVADMNSMPAAKAADAQNEDPFGLSRVIDDYETVIVDSLTSFSSKALAYGVTQVRGASMVQPQKQGYGFRTGLTFLLVNNIIQLTARKQKHAIFIAHEDAPDLNADGTIAQITFMLGGQLPSTIPVNLSEIWYLQDDGRERRIAVRPFRFRSPMKTRMFLTAKDPSFPWRYDAEKADDDPANAGHRIKDWYATWQADKGKILLPS